MSSADGGRQSPPGRAPACAASGRALPYTRNFFEKKLSKSFITPAGGTGDVRGSVYWFAVDRPARRRAGSFHCDERTVVSGALPSNFRF